MTTAETGQHIQLTTNNTTITAEGLHPYYNYHISVAAITIAADPYTVIQVVQTPQDGKQMKVYNSSTLLSLVSLQVYRSNTHIQFYFAHVHMLHLFCFCFVCLFVCLFACFFVVFFVSSLLILVLYACSNLWHTNKCTRGRH